MKLELVKEIKINGEIRYSIEADGRYIHHSLTDNLQQAEEYFNKIADGGSTEIFKQILKTTEINENKTD